MQTDDTIKQKKSELESVPPEYFNLGFYLITPLLLGVVAGYFLDKYFGQGHGFMIGGIVLGAIATFYFLWKLIKNSNT